jgi:hypothetical protein
MRHLRPWHDTAPLSASPPLHAEHGHTMSSAPMVPSDLSVNLRTDAPSPRHVGQLRGCFGARNHQATHITWKVLLQQVNLCELIASIGSKQIAHGSEPIVEGRGSGYGRVRTRRPEPSTLHRFPLPDRKEMHDASGTVSLVLAAPEGTARHVRYVLRFSLRHRKEPRSTSGTDSLLLAAQERGATRLVRFHLSLRHRKETRHAPCSFAATQGERTRLPRFPGSLPHRNVARCTTHVALFSLQARKDTARARFPSVSGTRRETRGEREVRTLHV